MKKIDEVAQPVSGDEKAFKAKHKIAVKDHPEGTKVPPTTTQKKKRLADYDTGQDEVAYEETETFYSVTWRDGNGMDKRQDGLTEDKAERLLNALDSVGASLVAVYEMSDAQMKKREDYVKGMKSKSDDLRKRYGKRWKDVMYAIATKNAMREELTGAQHKVDANKNGKLDAHDFKLLRSKKMKKEEVELDETWSPTGKVGKHKETGEETREYAKHDKEGRPTGERKWVSNKSGKSMKEEVEQIDELGQETLRNYHAKAAADLKVKRQKLDRGTLTSRDFKQGQNRVIGLNRAANKMEEVELDEVEQIDELSKKTLGNYIKAAKADQITKVGQEGRHYAGKRVDYQNREKGINRALDKLTREEIEQIDETGTIDPSHTRKFGEKIRKIGYKDQRHPKPTVNITKTTNTEEYMDEAVEELDEKLSPEQKSKIRIKLGPKTPNNPQRKDSEAARAYIQQATKKYPRYGFSNEEVEQIDEIGGQTTQKPISHPPTRPKSVEKKIAVKEAGDVIPPKHPKMKSTSGGENNFDLSKTRAKTFNVPTEKDRALEMDEAVEQIDEIGDTPRGQTALKDVRRRAFNRGVESSGAGWISDHDDPVRAKKYFKVADQADKRIKKEAVEQIDEKVTIEKSNHSWGKMIRVYHGSSHSYPLHPEHQEKIAKLGDGEKTSFKDETGNNVTAHREGENIHLTGSPIRTGTTKTTVARKHFTESVEQIDEISPQLAKLTLDKRIAQRDTAKRLSATAKSNNLPSGRYDSVAKKAGDKAYATFQRMQKEESAPSTRAFELIQKVKQMQEEKLKEQIEKEIIENEVELTEVFKPGNLKLHDGNVILVTKEQADPLNKLFHSLSDKNKKVMEDKLMKSRDSFSEILKFAKETV